jgi:enamine deaminase RidA (YjgF/YER057c/UK114 family)
MPEASRAREFHESWGFAQAVIAGDTIYLSGIVADRREDEQSFEPAYERVYAQVASILKRAGASWDDVIDLSSFHTDVEAQIRDLVAVHKRHVKAPYPAWTAIGVAKILGGGVTEIKVVAKRPRPGK